MATTSISCKPADPLWAALGIATNVHRGQKDKAGEPYILHPLRVMAAMETEEERIVALLHDVFEDVAPEHAWQFRREFETRFAYSPEIIEAVDLLTRRQRQDYLLAYIPSIRGNQLACRVKIADLRDNLDPRRIPLSSAGALERARRYWIALAILTDCSEAENAYLR